MTVGGPSPTAPGSAEWRSLGWISGIGALAFLARLLLMRNGTVVSPDGEQYLRIAENLLRHGCYSASDPASGSCAPFWGSQPPGYPAFVAGMFSLFGPLPEAVVIGQSILFCAALSYLL